MRKRIKNILAVIGVISLVTGITISIPLFLRNLYFAGSLVIGLLIIAGLILLAIAFGD